MDFRLKCKIDFNDLGNDFLLYRIKATRNMVTYTHSSIFTGFFNGRFRSQQSSEKALDQALKF